MREFASSGSRAAALSLPARLLYTVFAGLTLAALVSCVAIYDGIVRFEARATPQDLYRRLVEHYPPEARQRLLETTHAHLFTMPILLLVAGHLFLLSSASERAKLGWIGLASAATVTHLAAPWLVWATGGRGALGVLYPLTGGALLVSFAVLLAVPVREMWRRR